MFFGNRVMLAYRCTACGFSVTRISRAQTRLAVSRSRERSGDEIRDTLFRVHDPLSQGKQMNVTSAGFLNDDRGIRAKWTLVGHYESRRGNSRR